jgi:hypothetical protein
MRSELSFFTIARIDRERIVRRREHQASTREVSDTTNVASSFTTLAEESFK